jgi:hypothetical protein
MSRPAPLHAPLPAPRQAALLATLLCVLLLAASALRLHGLGQLSLWEDELFSADIVLQRPLVPDAGVPWYAPIDIRALSDGGTESFWTVKAADQSPPMFELAAKLVTAIAGTSEAALRLTSALAALAALAWLARRAWRARASPLMPVYLTVLVLTAFNGLMMFYAREARAYALGAALLTVLAVRFWERALAGWRQARLPGWGETALCVAACMTHYNALALVGLMLLPCAWQALRRRDLAALLRLAVVAACVIAWLALSYDNLVRTAAGQMGWHHGSVSRAFRALLVREVLGPWLIGLLALLGAVALWAAALGRPPGATGGAGGLGRASLGAGVLLVTAMYATLLIARRSGIVNERHLIFLLPVLFVLAGSCLALAAQRWRAATWVFLALASAAQVPLAHAALTAPKSEFRGAAAFVLARLQAGDALVTTPMLNPAAFNYYLQPSAHGLQRKVLLIKEQAPGLCTELAGHQRIGFYGHGSGLPLAVAMRDACGDRYDIDFYQRHMVFAGVWTRKP